MSENPDGVVFLCSISYKRKIPTGYCKYQLANNTFVLLKIYDALGREIETLVKEKQNAGTFEVEWNASEYPSGVYFYRLTTGEFKETKKLILLK